MAPKVLVIIENEVLDNCRRLLHAGANAYVLQSEPPQKFLAAVRAALRGDAWLSRAVVADLCKHANRKKDKVCNVSSLTPRQKEVAQLVASGLTNKQIALKLELSEKTIEKHIRNIKQKLKLHSRVAIATSVTGEGNNKG